MFNSAKIARLWIFVVTIIISSLQASAQINTNTPWTWMKGSNQIASFGNYGTMGVAHPSNEPFSRMGGSTFIDNQGNLWLFGGFSYLPAPMWYYFNDLWKFDAATNNWTWVKGSNLTNQGGNYGVKGVPATTNHPGAREGAMNWTDSFGNFWLFGGDGYDRLGIYGSLNDLWKYNVSTNNWVWIGGSEFVNHTGVYGTMGIPGTTNQPPGRSTSVSWSDSEGNLWLFGGYNYNYDFLNDLWRYNISSNEWTWINGSSVPGSITPVYGVLGTPSQFNMPAGRYKSSAWVGDDGHFYLFGGSNWVDRYNDLWKYSPADNEWTWINGANVPNSPPVQGIPGVPHAANRPGARDAAATFTDLSGNLWLFGGYGLTASPPLSADVLNDLWKYSPATNQWTWVKGGEFNAWGIYGTQGVAAPTNKPGGRSSAVSWNTPSDVFWMFGGFGNDETGLKAELNDLWKIYSPSVLPVKLLEFSGRLKNKNALLQWEISEHSTASRFIIERSLDGTQFDSVGFIHAASQKQFYHFSDELRNLNNPTIFYRLRMIDQDNSHTYSKVIVLKINSLLLTLYPNPATSHITITGSKLVSGTGSFKIIDQLGRIISSGTLIRPGAVDKIFIDISRLSPGTYRLVVFSDNNVRQAAFIKR